MEAGSGTEWTQLAPMIERLLDHRVDFVLIGGAAGAAHGSAYATYDVDVAYARDSANLERLAAALVSLHTTLRGAPADPPFLLDAETLRAGGNFTFATDLGALDILAYPAGAPSFDELRSAAGTIVLGGREVRVSSLDHLIRMKEAAGRPKDKLMATEYRVLAEEKKRRK